MRKTMSREKTPTRNKPKTRGNDDKKLCSLVQSLDLNRVKAALCASMSDPPQNLKDAFLRGYDITDSGSWSDEIIGDNKTLRIGEMELQILDCGLPWKRLSVPFVAIFQYGQPRPMKGWAGVPKRARGK